MTAELLQSLGHVLPGLLSMLGLICASAFFSASETALFYLSHDELRAFRSGRPRERIVAALMADPERLLTGILFWNLVINLLYFAVGVVIARQLAREGATAVAGLIGLGSLFGIILFGEVVPKSGAVVFRRRLAVLVCWPLAAAIRLIDPALPLLQRMALVARRTMYPGLKREPFLDTEDLERAVDEAEISAELARQERQVLRNILELSEIRVEEAMRPRGTYLALVPPVSPGQLEGQVPPGNYLVLLSDEGTDIESVVPLAEFVSLPEGNLEQSAERVVYVPWCATLSTTLQLLHRSYLSVAAVLNEYGEPVGIVSWQDIIDTILMPDPSRARRILRREPVIEREPGEYEVDGITTLRYLCRRLDREYEPTPDGLVTVAGMLHEQLEHIPEPGDECLWEGYHLRVTDVSENGSLKVLLKPAGRHPFPSGSKESSATHDF